MVTRWRINELLLRIKYCTVRSFLLMIHPNPVAEMDEYNTNPQI